MRIAREPSGVVHSAGPAIYPVASTFAGGASVHDLLRGATHPRAQSGDSCGDGNPERVRQHQHRRRVQHHRQAGARGEGRLFFTPFARV